MNSWGAAPVAIIVRESIAVVQLIEQQRPADLCFDQIFASMDAV